MSGCWDWFLPPVLPDDRGMATGGPAVPDNRWFGALVLPEDRGIGTGGVACVFVDLGIPVTDCCAVLEWTLSSDKGLPDGVLCSFLSTTSCLLWLLLITIFSFVVCGNLREGSAGSWRRPCAGERGGGQDILDVLFSCTTCAVVTVLLLYWTFAVKLSSFLPATSFPFVTVSLGFESFDKLFVTSATVLVSFSWPVIPTTLVSPFSVLSYFPVIEISTIVVSLPASGLFSSPCLLPGTGDCSLGFILDSSLDFLLLSSSLTSIAFGSSLAAFLSFYMKWRKHYVTSFY